MHGELNIMPRRSPTIKQANLIKRLPEVASGKKTMENAMIESGYSETSAHQQKEILGQIRNLSPMQQALNKAGVTIEKLSQKYQEGLEATDKDGNPDYHAQFKYVNASAELHDVFPDKKLKGEISGVVEIKIRKD